MFKSFSSSLLAVLCIPAVCAAQAASAEIPLPVDVPTVMTTQVMQARIEKLNLDLQAIGAYLSVGADGRLGCACGGGPTVPNVGGGRGPRSPLDTQHLVQALQALQLVLNNERAGLGTIIYSIQVPRVGAATALPH
jgi:hypothetical protein